MTKIEFIAQLYEKLSGLPQAEIEDRLSFYGEMIDERMEDGIPEEEAVAQLGSVDEIAARIMADIPLTVLVKERMRTTRRLSAWEIVLLVLGFPLWLPLLAAAFAVLLALYAAIWSVVIALWAVEVSLAASAVAVAAAGAFLALRGSFLAGAMSVGAGLICGGLAIFLFFGCKGVSRAMGLLTKKTALWVKRLFMRKEQAV